MTEHDDNPRRRLQQLCDVMNMEQPKDSETGKRRPSQRAEQLFNLIERWQKVPNLAALMMSQTTKWSESVVGQDLHQAAKPVFIYGRTGKSGAYSASVEGPNDYAPESWVIWMFAKLVTNPLCELLAGPCARCGDFYIKKRASQKVYCSRKCGNAATALVRTREKLDEKHRDRMKRAKAAMRKWRMARTEDDWKAFVSKLETDITAKFLTRAVNKGELTAPTKARK